VDIQNAERKSILTHIKGKEDKAFTPPLFHPFDWYFIAGMIIATFILIPIQKDINRRRKEFEQTYGSTPPIG